ncbi:MAG: nuclear transport factor 2 family protein [Pseudomonadota bacterium]|jgi:ketosteroid isomerase-like protein
MQPATHHDSSKLTALAHEWIARWNSHDLEHILALYADDAEMTSDIISARGLDPTGTLKGKERLRFYWSKAFVSRPKLQFELIEAFVSPDSVVVHYTDENGKRICEYLRLDANGKIRQGSANHLH